MKELLRGKCFRAVKAAAVVLGLSFLTSAFAEPMTPMPYAEKDWRVSSFKQMKKDFAKLKSTTLLFLGDSITQGWTATWIKHHGMDTWKTTLKKYSKVNYGISSDRVEHILWRVTEGKSIDHFTAKVIILMIGTNNPESPEEIAKGIENLVKVLQQKRPEAKILLLGVLPVSWRMQKSVQINDLICKFADNEKVFYRDYSKIFLTPDGKKAAHLHDGIHPDAEGYKLMAAEMVKDIDEILAGKKAEGAAK